MLTDSQSHVKRKTIKTPHRPTSREERSAAFGRNQTVFEPRITRIPRIRFADPAPSIRVICGIRCFCPFVPRTCAIFVENACQENKMLRLCNAQARKGNASRRVGLAPPINWQPVANNYLLTADERRFL